MGKRILFVCLACIAVAALWLAHLLWVAGAFKTVHPHFNGTCTPVAGLAGPEDITLDPSTGMAYISAVDRRAIADGRPGRGKIFGYDLAAPQPRPVDLTPQADPDFHPHGISLFKGKTDTLFVINHQGGKHRVEIFRIENRGLKRVKSLAHPMLTSPNDLVAVGPGSFYVTNDHGHVRGVMRTLEDYLRLQRSYVLYYDGRTFSKAVENIGYANGINVSGDGKTLYLTATTEKTLHRYARDTSTGRLTLAEKIDLDTGGDNIELDARGRLWIGAHPQLLKFTKHARSPQAESPSQVLRVSFGPDGVRDIREIYANRGAPLSGSSVAAVWQERMLIGAVFESRFLDCRRNPADP
jgi:arylesterase / paraoxonase